MHVHDPRPPASHPTCWRWPAWLDNPRCAWVCALRELYGMPIAFPDSISPEVGLLVHSLVVNLQPRTVVEVGAFVGASAHWIASALVESPTGLPSGDLPAVAPQLHVLDTFGPIEPGPWRPASMPSGRLEWIAARLRRAGLDRVVTLHPGDSAATLAGLRPTLEARGGVQLAFIDGDHTPEGVARDFAALEPMLNVGGHVLLHDTFPDQCCHTGPRALMDALMKAGGHAGTYERCELYSAPLNYGLALLRRTS